MGILEKNRKYIIVILLILVISVIAAVYIIFVQNKSGSANIKFLDKNNILSSFDNKQKAIIKEKIKKYLNNKKFANYDTVIFQSKKKLAGKEYYYFYLNDSTRILIEFFIYNNEYSFSYIGSSVNEKGTSSFSGISYLEIMNPVKYKKNQELNKIVEEGKNATPDSVTVTQDPNASIIIP